MKKTVPKALLWLVLMTSLCPNLGLAQQGRTTTDLPLEEVRKFLAAWVAGDEEVAMPYFSTTERAMQLAPNSVVGEQFLQSYWKLMDEIWRRQADTNAGLSIVDEELIQILGTELHVSVVSHVGDQYIAYIANSEESIELFTPQGTAEILLEIGRTLCVLAELPPGKGLPPPGPFVTFWQQETDDKWRIQTIGGLQQ